MAEEMKKRPDDVAVELWENAMRNEYRDSVVAFVDKEGEKYEKERAKAIFFSERKKRKIFFEQLGAPLTGDFDRSIRLLKKEPVTEDEELCAERYTFEVLGGVRFAGFIYRRKNATEGKKALIFALHGGGGTPERVGGLYHDSSNYNDMVRRVLKEDTLVFAPQLMLWNPDIYGSAYDRGTLNRRMLQQGGSFTAFEVFCLMRVLDWFETQAEVDTNRTGVIGLSYGGMYSLYFAAADKRIKSAVSDCWFNDRTKQNWHDWIYFGAERNMFDAEVASLVLPRKLYIEIAKSDPTFFCSDAVKAREALFAYAKKKNLSERLTFVEFEGEHELNKDDSTIRSFLQDLRQGE